MRSRKENGNEGSRGPLERFPQARVVPSESFMYRGTLAPHPYCGPRPTLPTPRDRTSELTAPLLGVNNIHIQPSRISILGDRCVPPWNKHDNSRSTPLSDTSSKSNDLINYDMFYEALRTQISSGEAPDAR